MNTDTPETDAMVSADQHHLEDDNFFSASVYWRMCDLARRIERELTEVTKQRDIALSDLEFRRDLYALQTKQLTAMTQQRDRLAEALERLEKTAGLPALHDDQSRIKARKALQYLTTFTQTEQTKL